MDTAHHAVLAVVSRNVMKARPVLTPLFCALAGSASAGAMPEAWQQYAAARVAPDYSWAQPAQPAPDALSNFYAVTEGTSATQPVAHFAWVGVAERDGLNAAFVSRGFAAALGDELSGRAFDSQIQGTRLAIQAGAQSEFGITAVVARQHFATQGFGYGAWDGSSEPRYAGVGTNVYESSSGSGVRLDWASPFGAAATSWKMAVQSRVEMDPFNAYRGVYGEPGDFDIPGLASLSLTSQLTPDLALSMEVQRVFYSEVDTFTSASLPTRFRSLLGDGGSPEFAWRDLTIYAVETRLADRMGGDWSLRFSTQQQPRPTSGLLDMALSELYSDTNVSLAYEVGAGVFGALRIAASYSPVSYFLGSSPYIDRDFEPGRQVEFEAQWALHF